VALSAGFESTVAVYDIAKLASKSEGNVIMEPSPTKDNVSCIKTVQDKNNKDFKTVFGTYDGRVNYVKLKL
jgi:hypothetical protein